jgi:hypothetical protein
MYPFSTSRAATAHRWAPVAEPGADARDRMCSTPAHDGGCPENEGNPLGFERISFPLARGRAGPPSFSERG